MQFCESADVEFIYFESFENSLWENGKEYLYVVKWAQIRHFEHLNKCVKERERRGKEDKKRKIHFTSLTRELNLRPLDFVAQ